MADFCKPELLVRGSVVLHLVQAGGPRLDCDLVDTVLHEIMADENTFACGISLCLALHICGFIL